MKIPGFTAEASLDNTDGYYQAIADVSYYSNTIQPATNFEDFNIVNSPVINNHTVDWVRRCLQWHRIFDIDPSGRIIPRGWQLAWVCN